MSVEVVIIILQQLPHQQLQLQLHTAQLTWKMMYHLKLLLLVFMHSITHEELQRRNLFLMKEPGIMSSLKSHLSFANKEDATVMDRWAQEQVLLEQEDKTLDQLDVVVERVRVF
jgi:hypothetical protein